MKRLVCALALVAACGGDDGGSAGIDGGNNGGGGGGGGGSGSDAAPPANEPSNLTGITAAHNTVRAMVDTSTPLPALVWSPELAAHATAWAEMCEDNDAPQGLVDHSSSGYRSNVAGFSYVGENIFASGAAPASAQQAVQTWAAEKSNFTYPNGCSGICGHYTQVVWRASTHLGCANVTCNGLQYPGVILCMYGPGGNNGGAPY